MPAPAVKGYIALCVTPRSKVCDEQGVGQWPMWKRYDSVKAIVDLYIDAPYRNFLARPEFDVDRQKAEEYFYWYTPLTGGTFTRLSNTGSDHDYYRKLLDETLVRYRSAIDQLKVEGKTEEAEFLELSLKYAGDSEDNVYCGDDRVVAALWGMRPRPGSDIHDSVIQSDLFPPLPLHTVRYNLGTQGTTSVPTDIRKSHGSRIFPHQVPQVTAVDGYRFTGWDRDPVDVVVDHDMQFTAMYVKDREPDPVPPVTPVTPVVPRTPVVRKVRFLMPDGKVIRELEVEDGTRIKAGDIPQLPDIDGIRCSAWDGDPADDVISSDKDYKAICNAANQGKKHNVRFLKPGGELLTQYQVEDGTHLTQSQIPPLPVVDGRQCTRWNADPLNKKITSDTDFVAQMPEVAVTGVAGRGGCLSAILNWLLLLLGILLLWMLFWCFVLGKCNFDFCGCNCVNPPAPVVDPVVDTKDVPEPDPGPRPVPHSGDVQILLSWANRNDLDIACIDPTGQIVWYQNKVVPSGGRLDIDMNAGSGPHRTDPIENIYWPEGNAPKGQYKVILTYYADHENNGRETPYTVKVKHGDTTDTYTGTVRQVRESVLICSFEIE